VAGADVQVLHRSRTGAKIRDVVGLYLHPPAKAVVLCVDEKPQIQARERTAAPLPVRPGHPAAASFDYRRHGTTTLFAALEVATGRVAEACTERTATRSSWPSCARWLGPIRAGSCTWWWTTCSPASIRRCVPGWSAIPR
jgi:hypothetical protein